MRRRRNMGTLDVWYDHLDIDQVLDWVHTEVGRGTNWQEGGEGGGRGCREGEDARQHAGLREAGRRGRRRSSGSSPTPR